MNISAESVRETMEYFAHTPEVSEDEKQMYIKEDEILFGINRSAIAGNNTYAVTIKKQWTTPITNYLHFNGFKVKIECHRGTGRNDTLTISW